MDSAQNVVAPLRFTELPSEHAHFTRVENIEAKLRDRPAGIHWVCGVLRVDRISDQLQFPDANTLRQRLHNGFQGISCPLATRTERPRVYC